MTDQNIDALSQEVEQTLADGGSVSEFPGLALTIERVSAPTPENGSWDAEPEQMWTTWTTWVTWVTWVTWATR